MFLKLKLDVLYDSYLQLADLALITLAASSAYVPAPGVFLNMPISPSRFILPTEKSGPFFLIELCHGSYWPGP